MYLQLDAERSRRVLLCLGLCGACALQAWWPHPRLDQLGNSVVAPLTALIAPLAGELLPPPLSAAALSELGAGQRTATITPSLPSLAKIEARLGRPPNLPALTWLEVPLAYSGDDSSISKLQMGSADGVGGKAPVVFAKQWLGRVESEDESTARILHWRDSDVRTGIWLRAEDGGDDLRAICTGRGGEAPALVRFIEPRCEPLGDTIAHWRIKPGDVPGLAGLGLEVGTLRRIGDETRGEGHWVIESELPAGAGGRVFVAASAVPAQNTMPVPIDNCELGLISTWDGVFGDQAFCARVSSDQVVVAALSRGHLVGPVVRQAGAFVWVTRPSIESWQQKAMVWNSAQQSLSVFGNELADDSILFSAGDGWIPRGLLIGTSDRANHLLAPRMTGVLAVTVSQPSSGTAR